MIVQLTGTLIEVLPTHAVLDVGGVGYELGISSSTAAALPQVGEAGVTVLTRLIVREVGPKLALSVLSTFSPAQLATVVATQDIARMAQVPGVGKRKGQRLLVELEGVFSKDVELRGLVGLEQPTLVASAPTSPTSVAAEATDALLSMGFSPQEAELALEGYEEAGATTIEKALSFALRRLGGGR